jgi:hypothetical protein
MTSLTLAIADTGAAAAPLPKLGKKDLAHIPGETGWPVIGNTLRAVRNPVAHTQDMHAKVWAGLSKLSPRHPRGHPAWS